MRILADVQEERISADPRQLPRRRRHRRRGQLPESHVPGSGYDEGRHVDRASLPGSPDIERERRRNLEAEADASRDVTAGNRDGRKGGDLDAEGAKGSAKSSGEAGIRERDGNTALES